MTDQKPNTVYVVTREACELTEWDTLASAFETMDGARQHAREAAEAFVKLPRIQLIIPCCGTCEIIETPDGFRVDDGGEVNVLFQVHELTVEAA